MKKNTLVKVISVVLSLVAVFCMAIPSFAADITTNGGNGATPVNLSSTDDGTLGGDPAATALSVTLPTAFPLAMGTDGTVTTADNCKIVNNSYGAVRVKSATINGANGWSLTAFGDKAILASAKVDSDMLGFELALNNGTAYKTDSSNETTQKFFSNPAVCPVIKYQRLRIVHTSALLAQSSSLGFLVLTFLLNAFFLCE